MRASDRKISILNELLNSSTFLNSEHFADLTGVSSRTVRSDLKALTHELQSENIELISSPGRGFSVPQKDKNVLRKMLSENEKAKRLPNTPKERVNIILQELLFAQEALTLETLGEKLFVSKSTIESDLVEVESWLKEQNLKLSKKHAVGMQLEGSETAWRYATLNCLMQSQNPPQQGNFNVLEEFFNIDYLKNLRKNILRVQNRHSLNLSDNHFFSLLTFLTISIQRHNMSHPLPNQAPKVQGLKKKKEFEIARDLRTAIKQNMYHQMDQTDVNNLAEYLLQADIFETRSLLNEESSKFTEKELENLLKRQLSSIHQSFSLDFSADEELRGGLLLYLNSLIHRREHKVQIKNPNLSEIRQSYPQALEMAIRTARAVQDQYQVSINHDETGYLALYYCAALERFKLVESQQQKRVAVICSEGLGTSQLLAVKTRRLFPELHLTGIFPAYRLEEALSTQPDLLLSTIPLENKQLPIIQVSPLLNAADTDKIHSWIEQSNFSSELRQRFENLFNAELFFTDLDLVDKKGVVQYLSGKLAEQKCVSTKFGDAVLEREALFSTAIGNLVAIPHAQSDQTDSSCICVGSLRKPILWDEEKVQLVFLLNLKPDPHLDIQAIFEHFYEILNSKRVVRKLIKASSFTEFMEGMYD